MVFSSVIFLFLFLPGVLTAYFIAPPRRRNHLLLLANLLFYSWGEGRYILVLLASILGNYFLALLIQRFRDAGEHARARAALAGATVFNLSLLVFFKYAGFLVGNIAAFTELLGLGRIPVPDIHLPIGISFFTFQALSYVIDVHRGAVRASTSLVNFATYKSLFPQLVAGPIVRYKDVVERLTHRQADPDRFLRGVSRFTLGLAKKVLVANTVAAVADRIFDLPPGELTAGITWLGVTAYTLQIYFDFSGYSDMAIGLGRMLGFDFLENFDHPYVARSVREFWRRWHISLSTWFRDYLYIPLGGNRGSAGRTSLNLFVVFLLCGFWHGAAWTFLIWGFWHGFFLVLERTPLAAPFRAVKSPLAGHAYTLLAVSAGWVFFRAATVGHALYYLAAMAGFGAGDGRMASLVMAETVDARVLLAMAAGLIGSTPVPARIVVLLGMRVATRRGRFSPLIRGAWATAAAACLGLLFFVSILLLAGGTYNPFIYFRF